MGQIVIQKGRSKRVFPPARKDREWKYPGSFSFTRLFRIPFSLVPESTRVRMGKEEGKLIKRAISLWRKESEVLPDFKSCDIRCANPDTRGDQRYVMLRDADFLLAVFRIKRDGTLKRLKLGKFPLSHLECGAYDDDAEYT